MTLNAEKDVRPTNSNHVTQRQDQNTANTTVKIIL